MSKPKHDVEVTTDTAPAAQSDRWRSMLSLRDEVDRLFDEFGAGLWRPLSRRLHGETAAGGAWRMAPAVEMVEQDGDYRLTAELPGMSPGDVEVRLTDGTLVIRGEKSRERHDETADYLLRERAFGAFHRVLALPAGVDPDAITATCRDGVLTVTMPKTEAARQNERKVEVTAA